ncbi:MAG: nucleotide exchange factor GrpE [Rikenellaceae bacterium]
MSKQKTKNQKVTAEQEMTQEQIDQSVTDTMTAEQEAAQEAEQAETDTMAEETERTQEPAEASEQPQQAKEENIDWKDRYIRLQAEFDNFRKRTLKEKMELVQNGGSDTIKAFLPIVDDIERAEVAMAKSDDITALRDGVSLISQKLVETLKQRGVVEIEAVGLALDTDRHEAVAKFAAGDDKKDTIIDVVQKGYVMGDKVLRFAKVVVGE